MHADSTSYLRIGNLKSTTSATTQTAKAVTAKINTTTETGAVTTTEAAKGNITTEDVLATTGFRAGM